MEYVFGNTGSKKTLKTKGDSHTDLIGFHQLRRDYDDQTIIDEFRILKKIKTAEDSEGNCYDWYEIDSHYRITDKFTPNREAIEGGIADTQDAICEVSEELEQRIADIEDALCELEI
ncbi:MAG: hypothetical protein IJT16_08065 [Lachnospiraceae bacterium]|nr:hypothetical protein [Lachnospiraceae bacterium]